MTTTISLITARVITATSPRAMQGTYVVEKDLGNGNVILANSSEKITVQVPPQSLSVGNEVFVKAQGNNLIIEKMVDQPSQNAQAAVQNSPNYPLKNELDALVIAADAHPNIPVRIAPQTLSFVFQIPLVNGFYTFDSPKEAVAWIAQNKPDLTSKETVQFMDFFKNSAVALKVSGDDSSGGRALAMPLKQAAFDIGHFVKSQLRADFWKSVSPEILSQTLLDRGSLSTERLAEIDSTLLLSESPPAPGPIQQNFEELAPVGLPTPMAKNVLDPVIAQWLNIALDENTPLKALFPTSSFAGAVKPFALAEMVAAIIKLDINDVRTQQRFASPLTLEDFSLTEDALTNEPEKQNLIPRIVRGIGLNFENTLANFDLAANSLEMLPPSLKEFLLRVVGSCPEDLGKQPNNSLPVDSDKQNQTTVQSVAPETLSKKIAVHLEASLKNPQLAANTFENRVTNALKHQAQAAIGHIESMQFLAKQTPAAQGEQQLIVVPMKLDGQWTDVVIKMVKNNKNTAKKNNRKTVSIAINVAPSFLGEINIGMDYASKQDFKIHIKFGKDQTRRWFEKNKSSFTEALKKIGFPAPMIDLRMVKADKPLWSSQPGASGDDSRIDVVI